MQRKQYSAGSKARIALEAIKGLKTVNELATKHGVHPTQIHQWKKQLLDELPGIFSSGRAQSQKNQEDLTASLYQSIGTVATFYHGNCPTQWISTSAWWHWNKPCNSDSL